jgi:hypothetical protein
LNVPVNDVCHNFATLLREENEIRPDDFRVVTIGIGNA